MPPLTKESDRRDLIKRRHPEHTEFENRWLWEQDTYESGDRYRLARYGNDTRGYAQRNMIRYKRDYGIDAPNLPGSDPAASATDNDYELRVARTPPPTHLDEAVGIHLSKVFKTDPQRKGPAALEAWWKDVDGKGTSIGEWLMEIAPLFLINAQIDICFDHPAPPEGEIIDTRADELRLGMTKCIASYILPQNMLWWRLDRQGRYVECLVREPQEDGSTYYRHWTPTDWTLYSETEAPVAGQKSAIEIVATGPHKFGRPPIERVLFRKRTRCTHVGVNLYESICELSRAIYNLDGELVLSDSTQAHPTLQAPSPLLTGGEVQVGPNGVLPMYEYQSGDSGQMAFQGWEYVDPPKGAAESIRQNMQRLRDEIDRVACLTKPAGAQGNTGSVVSQSGLSKVMDQSTGNDLLSKLASRLAYLERVAATLALLVLGDGRVDASDLAAIQISYPKTFELADTVGLTMTIEGYQSVIEGTGACPKTETELVKRFIRVALPGRDPDLYDELDEENAAFIESKAATYEQDQEAEAANAQAMNQAKSPAAPKGDPVQDDDVEEDQEP